MRTKYAKDLGRLKAKHAKELMEAEMMADIANTLAPVGLEPASMYVHDDDISVKYEKDGYFSKYTAAEVLEMLDLFSDFGFVPAELRKDSCIQHIPSYQVTKDVREKTKHVCNYLHYFDFTRGWKYDRQGVESTTFSNEDLNFWVKIPAGKWSESTQAHEGSLLLNVEISGAGDLARTLESQAGVSGDIRYPAHSQAVGTGGNSSKRYVYWGGTSDTV
jgi:hypothetical protein